MKVTINFLVMPDLMLTSYFPIKFNRIHQQQSLKKNSSRIIVVYLSQLHKSLYLFRALPIDRILYIRYLQRRPLTAALDLPALGFEMTCNNYFNSCIVIKSTLYIYHFKLFANLSNSLLQVYRSFRESLEAIRCDR